MTQRRLRLLKIEESLDAVGQMSVNSGGLVASVVWPGFMFRNAE